MSETRLATPPDVATILEEIRATERDAQKLVDGLSEEQGTRRIAPGTWSVAECLDHLATANRVYIDSMTGPAQRARERGRMRRGPALPGLPGRMFAASLEPPARAWMKVKAHSSIQPRESPRLDDAMASFNAAQERVHDFFTRNADLDLAHTHFPNPFVRGIRFSLATGLHVIAAHNRRHLVQAWNVRRQLT